MQTLIDVLTINPDPFKRSNEIKQQIAEALEQIKFFSEFLKSEKIKQNARHLLLEFSNYLNLERYKFGELICKEGDKGDKFYIILQGRVSVFRKNLTLEQEKNACLSEYEFLEQNTKIGELKEGETFGELALSLNKPRFATIKALTQSVVVCALSKDNYSKMTNYMQRELTLKTTALATLFPKLSQNSLIRLAYLMQVQVFPKNHCVYKQGQMATGFYILSDGEVKLEQVQKNKPQIYIPIMVLTPGSLFGVQNVLKQIPYDNQAICLTQKVTLYKFSRESFEQLGDDYSQRALQAAEKTSRREPKIQSLSIGCESNLKISLREMNEENERNNNNVKIIKSLGNKHRKVQKTNTVHVKNQITFRNPFFTDLDADNFKQIKKISIEQIKLSNLKKYNQQFSVHNFFEPIDIAPMLDQIKKMKNQNHQSSTTQRENTSNLSQVYTYPASGFNTTRQNTIGSSFHSRQVSISKKKHQ